MSASGKGGFGGSQIGGGPAPIQQPSQPDIYARMGGQQNVDSNPYTEGYQPPTSSPMQPPVAQPAQPSPTPGMGGGKSGGGKGGFGATPEQRQQIIDYTKMGPGNIAPQGPRIGGGPAPLDPNTPSPLGPEGQQPLTPQPPGGWQPGMPGGKSQGSPGMPGGTQLPPGFDAPTPHVIRSDFTPGTQPPTVGTQPTNGLNQQQQDYFKYANAQRSIGQQNEQANNARWTARQKAINDAGYGTGSAPGGNYNTIKDAAALKFMGDWDAANPYNNQAYDQNYSDFNAYAQKNLGFNPNDPNNPNSVNGFANYDMGLSEVRQPHNSMAAYVNPTEGYQDRQGNYYDMSGNPMAPPSWASKTPSNRNFGDLFGLGTGLQQPMPQPGQGGGKSGFDQAVGGPAIEMTPEQLQAFQINATSNQFKL